MCGRQNIPLRGHRDSLNNFEHDPSAQHGNFWALLQFGIEAGDTVLNEHLLSGSVVKRNATYTSYRIQNDILDILGNIITQKIVTKIKMASYYADEVTDCSNKEQLAIVLRYVNAGDNITHEDFLAFLECDSGITGSAVSKNHFISGVFGIRSFQATWPSL